MKDHFAAYRKGTFKKNAAIAVSAFVLAVSVNAVLFGTETGLRLQTSAVEFASSPKGAQAPDLSLVSAGTGTDLLKLRFAPGAKSVREFRATLLSNPSALKILDVSSTDDKTAEIVKIANEPGVMLVNVRYPEAKDIAPNADLVTVAYQKTGSGKTVVNLAETSFVSSGATYDLSNSPVEF
jgi:hypothetical protein